MWDDAASDIDEPFYLTRWIGPKLAIAIVMSVLYLSIRYQLEVHSDVTTNVFGLAHMKANLFLFLGAVAFGTLIGGPIGDRIGTKRVIWVSILGVLPFTLALPYADLTWTTVLSMVIGMVLASAFPAIIVFAQELLPGRVGFVAGIFFGLAFGLSGISAAVLGQVADWKGIEYVYSICSFLPAIGLLTVLLPDIRRRAN